MGHDKNLDLLFLREAQSLNFCIFRRYTF